VNIEVWTPAFLHLFNRLRYCNTFVTLWAIYLWLVGCTKLQNCSCITSFLCSEVYTLCDKTLYYQKIQWYSITCVFCHVSAHFEVDMFNYPPQYSSTICGLTFMFVTDSDYMLFHVWIGYRQSISEYMSYSVAISVIIGTWYDISYEVYFSLVLWLINHTCPK